MKRFLLILFPVLILCGIGTAYYNAQIASTEDREIVCRVSGCGNAPVYDEWDDRFCAEHIDKSQNHAHEYNHAIAQKKINTERALTKEEADRLRGTGYHGTKPHSSAEEIELKAAMVACKKCGMRSHNGLNSLCDECRYNEEYGFD